MKKLLMFFLFLFSVSAGCSSDKGSAPDPLASFRSFSYDLRDMVHDWQIESGRGFAALPDDATEDELNAYLKAISDIGLSQWYCVTVYNNVINFNILNFLNSVYTNTDRDMTIDVSGNLYAYQWDYYLTEEQGYEDPVKVRVDFTWNPATETWLLLGWRGGNATASDPPNHLWLKQEGAVISNSTYYVSSAYHVLLTDTTGSARTMNAIVTYGGAEIELQMAGEHVDCFEDCIDDTDTPIFTDGITTDIEAWDDFKMIGITTIDYEITP